MASDFFRAAFTGSMRESTTGTITLEGLHPSCVQALIGYAHNGHSGLLVLEEHLEAMLIAADQLGFAELLPLIGEKLCGGVTAENCVDRLVLADRHSLPSLRASALDVLTQHFRSLSHAGSLAALTQSVFSEILSADDLDLDEIDLFDALVAWRAHDVERHGAAFDALFALLRLPRMGIEALASRVVHAPAVLASERAQQSVRDSILYLTVPSKRAELTTPITVDRGRGVALDVVFESTVGRMVAKRHTGIHEDGKLVKRTSLAFWSGAVANALPSSRRVTWKLRVDGPPSDMEAEAGFFLGLVKRSGVEALNLCENYRTAAADVTVGICFKMTNVGDVFELTADTVRQELRYLARLVNGRTTLDGLTQLEGAVPWMAGDDEWAPVVQATHHSAIRVIE